MIPLFLEVLFVLNRPLFHSPITGCVCVRGTVSLLPSKSRENDEVKYKKSVEIPKPFK